MDSDRRHELETNDLKEFLDNFKDFWEKHGNKLLITLIVVLGGYAGYGWYNKWKDDKIETAQKELAGATSVDALLAVANEHDRVHDEAMRRAGDLALGAARSSLFEGSDTTAQKSLKQAGSAYTALADRGKTVEYQLIGHEGLAQVAIMASEWDEAKTHYSNLIELAGEAHPAQAARAEAGLSQLDLLKQPLAFAPEEDFSFDFDGDSPGEEEPDTPVDTGDADTPDDEPDPVVPEIDLPDPLNPGG